MLTKKYGAAPSRNTFKRRARSLFYDLTQQHSGLSIGLMIKPLKKAVSYPELMACFVALSKKIIVETK